LKRQLSPYRTGPKHPENYRTGHNKFAQGSPQPYQTTGSPGTLPIWGGTRNSAVTPIQSQGLKRQLSPYRTGPRNPRKLPHRTPINLCRGLPSHFRLRVAQVTSLLWGGTRNSAVTPIQSQGLKRTFTLPHRTQTPPKTTGPGPNEFAQGSPQPYQTTGSPGTLPHMGRDP